MKNKSKGFSLVEMMIVIAIVAILVAVVVPIVGASRNKAKGAVDAANIRSMMAEVATKRVSENDETKLLDGMSIVDSEITPNSNVLFYIVNENEIRAYYSSSLLFYNHLRGTEYNGAVADTGDLDSPYDVLPADARPLGALTSNGASVTGDTLVDAQNAEIEKVANAIAEGFLGLYGLEDGKSTQEKAEAVLKLGADISKALLNSQNRKLGDQQFYANLKVAMMDSLMEEYEYDAKTAETMVSSGDFATSLTIKTGDDKTDKALKEIMTQITENTDVLDKPECNASDYFGCTSTGFIKKNWTHGMERMYAEFEAYCEKYGLQPNNDCEHPK